MATKDCVCADNLNRRVSVRRLKPSDSTDASGHIDETVDSNWEEIGKRWVAFATKGSREFFRREEVAADITHQITMRYDGLSKTFTTKMQLKMGDRKFNIAEPPRNVNEANQMLIFACTEIK